ncbi:UTP--glucose-1-phosphate uridylyltransferase GalU [Aureibacillus halotolerans]|uniref:UTP--glucose-1-phosphate uridylyltransferase n=1 Tax=Aureibacillus halotolerans TaxID=1508390 RepID=A0A4R6TRB8_9BACI|nr:UTP--glucose-1-phosphate uridylyltransferase GalU [Aureibacillus halotolerans]TDQ36100.1 UTP--glucose-1-phosphate uridylyltransferase [Aureibacillus halotolerans]
MNIKKAIIPAAGLGTRFLPATKAQPKEMLPIVDKPTIQFIVEEAVAAGIEDIMIVTGRGKRAIEDHFDKSYELEETLEKRGEWKRLEEIRTISQMANIHYIRQKEPQGLGHAIYCARSFIGDEPFAVLLGDDIVQHEVPCLKQLMEVHNTYGGNVVGIQQVPSEAVNKYGIIDPGETLAPGLHEVKGMIEKPAFEHAPSNYAIMGRYLLEPSIFDVLAKQPPGRAGEIQLTDALQTLNNHSRIYAYEFDGLRFDVGDKLGFVKATIHWAMNREDMNDELSSYLRDVIRDYEAK